ncbi:Hypothetical protein UVM_LOCUS352, partial [uncultured virus]
VQADFPQDWKDDGAPLEVGVFHPESWRTPQTVSSSPGVLDQARNNVFRMSSEGVLTGPDNEKVSVGQLAGRKLVNNNPKGTSYLLTVDP